MRTLLVTLALGLLPGSLRPAPAAGQDRCPEVGDTATEAGWVAFRAGRLERARDDFSRALELCPLHSGARTGLAYVDLREGRDEEARTGLTAVLEVSPESVDALSGLGILAWRRGDLAEVGRLFQQVEDLDPGNPTAADYLGRIPAGWGTSRERANEAWNRGDTDTAAELYRTILAADSTDSRALHRLALAHAWDEDYTEALELLDRLLGLEPTNLEAGVARARVLAWQGNLDEAIGALDRILTAHPTYSPAAEAKAQFRSWAGEYTEALSSYDQLVGISQDPTELMLAQARVLGWAARTDESQAVYDSILTVNPQNLEARLGLAQNLRWQGRNAAAKEVLDGADPGQRKNPEFLEQLGGVRSALAPRVGISMVQEEDSDDNLMRTAQMTGRWNPFPRLALDAVAYTKELEQTAFDLARSSWGASLQASYQLEPGWVFRAGAGGSRSTGTASSSTVLKAGIVSPGRYPIGGGVSLNRYPLDATAQLVEQGVRVTMGEVSGRWSPAPGWQVSGTMGFGTFSGDEENQRIHANARINRGVGGGFTLGLSHRYFGFDKNLDEFYFDPDYFGLSELTGRWAWQPGRVGFLLEAAPGIQKIQLDGEYRGAFRASARLSLRVAQGREISLAGGYSSAGLQSFSTGDSDYQYTALILGARWVF